MNYIVAAWQFVVAHQEPIVSGLSVALGGAVRHFWPQAEAKAVSDLSGLGQGSPAVKALALKVDQWIEQAVPNAGDARYDAAAAILVHDEPALAPFQPEVVSILTALGGAVKEVAAKAAEPATPAVVSKP